MSDPEHFDFDTYVRDIEAGRRSTLGVQRFLEAIRRSQWLRSEFLDDGSEETGR